MTKTAEQHYQAGQEFESNGDRNKAYKSFRKAAKEGHKQATMEKAEYIAKGKLNFTIKNDGVEVKLTDKKLYEAAIKTYETLYNDLPERKQYPKAKGTDLTGISKYHIEIIEDYPESKTARNLQEKYAPLKPEFKK